MVMKSMSAKLFELYGVGKKSLPLIRCSTVFQMRRLVPVTISFEKKFRLRCYSDDGVSVLYVALHLFGHASLKYAFFEEKFPLYQRFSGLSMCSHLFSQIGVWNFWVSGEADLKLKMHSLVPVTIEWQALLHMSALEKLLRVKTICWKRAPDLHAVIRLRASGFISGITKPLIYMVFSLFYGSRTFIDDLREDWCRLAVPVSQAWKRDNRLSSTWWEWIGGCNHV